MSADWLKASKNNNSSKRLDMDTIDGNVANVEDGELKWIDKHLVDPDPDQPREQYPKDSIEELRGLIETEGQTTPVTVVRSESRYTLRHGQRRHTAIMASEKVTKILAIIKTDNKSSEDVFIEQIIDNEHERLKPLELAKSYQRLALSHSSTWIADRLCKTKSFVSMILALAPDNIADSVRQLSEKHDVQDFNALYHLNKLALASPADAESLIARFLSESMPVAELRKEAVSLLPQKVKRSKKATKSKRKPKLRAVDALNAVIQESDGKVVIKIEVAKNIVEYRIPADQIQRL